MKIIHPVYLLTSVALLLVCIMTACRRSGPTRVSLEEIRSQASFVTFAHGEWKPSGELAIVAEDSVLANPSQSLVGAPQAGVIVETVKFQQRPNVPPESFVVFYRTVAGRASVLVVVPVHQGILSSVLDKDGKPVARSELLKILKTVSP